MSHSGLAAAGVEPAYAVGLDVGAPWQTELPFDSDLDGQPWQPTPEPPAAAKPCIVFSR